MTGAVFLHYDQTSLDNAYDQAAYAPNREQILARRNRNAELTRERLGEPKRLAYGAGRNEQLDLFSAVHGAAMHVFIHGGAWRVGRARDYAAPAEMFVDAGAHYVALDFDNVDQTGGDLMAMARQVRHAVAWIYRNAERLGGDPDRIYVSGTSSGAHLGAVVATTDWPREFGLPRDCVKGYTLCSGMYDLRAPRLSKRSAYVNFTDEVEDVLSPQRHLDRIHTPICLLFGSEESPEFKRQSEEFAAALRRADKPVELFLAFGYNHFEIQETLASPYGPLGRAVLRQMGLPPIAAALHSPNGNQGAGVPKVLPAAKHTPE